jgi:hypothetical protein
MLSFFLLPFAVAAEPVWDVALVPGCPTNDDGTISECQWRRVAWVAHLWRQGRFSRVITSGAAVHNAYVEADAMAHALVAAGLPADAVLRERNALHTDQNIAFSLNIALAHGLRNVVVATDRGQAGPGCAMVRAWAEDVPCLPLPIDADDPGFPGFAVPAAVQSLVETPVGRWEPLAAREARIAEATGQRPRPSSFFVYLRMMFRTDPPELPPPELRTP